MFILIEVNYNIMMSQSDASYQNRMPTLLIK